MTDFFLMEARQRDNADPHSGLYIIPVVFACGATLPMEYRVVPMRRDMRTRVSRRHEKHRVESVRFLDRLCVERAAIVKDGGRIILPSGKNAFLFLQDLKKTGWDI